jgi:hypothetical protein
MARSSVPRRCHDGMVLPRRRTRGRARGSAAPRSLCIRHHAGDLGVGVTGKHAVECITIHVERPHTTSGVPTSRSRQTSTTGLAPLPSFADAVQRHEVIATIERSAASGERLKAWGLARADTVRLASGRWADRICLVASRRSPPGDRAPMLGWFDHVEHGNGRTSGQQLHDTQGHSTELRRHRESG